MDEKSYKETRDNIALLRCAFEKTILASRLCCSQSSRKNIAEREIVCCSRACHVSRCRDYLGQLRYKAQFTLQLKQQGPVTAELPHAKEMRLQIGGILGLLALEAGDGFENECVQHAQTVTNVPDVFSALESCIKHFGRFDQIPFDRLMRHILRVKPR